MFSWFRVAIIHFLEIWLLSVCLDLVPELLPLPVCLSLFVFCYLRLFISPFLLSFLCFLFSLNNDECFFVVVALLEYRLVIDDAEKRSCVYNICSFLLLISRREGNAMEVALALCVCVYLYYVSAFLYIVGVGVDRLTKVCLCVDVFAYTRYSCVIRCHVSIEWYLTLVFYLCLR